jgi:ribonuclease VapC
MSGRKPAGDFVESLLAQAELGHIRLLMSAINVGEVYYFLRKHDAEALAESWRGSAATLPVTIEAPTIDDIWNAAIMKSRYPIAYADAFAGALARKYRCPLITGDTEFRHVDELELDWIATP